MLKTFALAAAASLAALTLAAPAFADEDAFANATLAKPVAKQTQVIAGGVVWTCKDASCSGPATADGALSVGACKALVKSVGPVVAYGVETRKLSGEELTKCDGGKLPG